ncbi:unnamed protein product [Paramecium pentaurelia]|uniref:Transmembrane protein n=1 Tax=Paramecium pentaurelia TaxID=43138 RepID=A0A8S1W8Z1_9CILI|nr:unnamed protein product [Paramecium pentaurelia]
MQKYTLRFKDSKIEEQYLIHRSNTLQFPTLTYVTGGGSLLLIINFFVYLISEKYQNALKNGIVSFYLFLQYIILRKYVKFRKYSNNALLICNLIFIAFEFENPDPLKTYYDGYLLGSNQMLVHTILMFANDLKQGILANLTHTISKILIVQLYDNKMIAQQYVYTILLSLSYILIQYEIEKQYRNSFFLSLKDSTWEKMIPLFLKKPYFLFSFNKEENAYQIISSYLKEYFESETPLTTFLYQSKVSSNESLQAYIQQLTVKSIKHSDNLCLFNQYLNVDYLNKKVSISIIAYQFEKVIYAIIIESEDPIRKEQKLKYLQQIQIYKKFFHQQIMPINKVLATMQKENYHPLLTNLRISLIEIYYQQSQVCELKIVTIKKLLQKCVQLFQTSKNAINIVCNEDIKFVTLKHALIIFLLEILKTSNGQFLQLRINQLQNATLQIIGLNHLPQSEIFKKSKEMLIERVLEQQNCFIFIFMKTPQSSFSDYFYIQDSNY